jgi:hypothetical protein
VLGGTLRAISEHNDADRMKYSITWIVDVESVLKGTYAQKEIEFSMLVEGAPPNWSVPVPLAASKGERWIVFLKEEEGQLVPFAGLNGMLRVDGSQLIYDSAVDYGMTRKQLMAVVEATEANR